MKKLKLSEINLGNAEVLSREELKTVRGGLSSSQEYMCVCYDMPGTWTGDYPSQDAADADIDVYCRQGGKCNPVV